MRERSGIVVTANQHNTGESYHMHYYQFNIADYRKDTQHLSPMEHYIYRQLLDWMYLDESPIPKNIPAILRRLRLPNDRSTDVEQVLNDFFTERDDGYIQARALFEINEYRRKIECASAAGKASAKARKSKKNKDFERPFNDRSTTVQPTINHKPLTNNHKRDSPVTPDGEPPPPKSERAKPKTRLPENFTVTRELVAWAEDKNYGHIDLSGETEKFLDYWRRKGGTNADWSACWRTWIRNADKFQREQADRAGGRAAIAAAIHGD